MGQLPRIVVAEDTQYMRDLIVLMLRHQGFDVVGVADGDAALAAMLAEGADALVSDLNMPGLDGLTLGRVLRALRAYAAIPIVVFTGVEGTDARLSALRDLSPVRVLSKPMGLRDIAPALTEMLARQDTRRGAGVVSDGARAARVPAATMSAGSS